MSFLLLKYGEQADGQSHGKWRPSDEGEVFQTYIGMHVWNTECTVCKSAVVFVIKKKTTDKMEITEMERKKR